MLPSPFKDKGYVREENAEARALLSEGEDLDRFGVRRPFLSDVNEPSPMSHLALFVNFDSELRGFRLSPTVSLQLTYSIYYYKLSLGVSPSQPPVHQNSSISS